MDSQLRREIEILSNMHHPHIVELLAVFDDKANDVVHIVMPMCAGGELFDRITKDRTQVKTVDAAVYAQQMLSSIEYLHAQAIVHRDLKPENFMFLTPEEDSDLVLIDFGISTFFHRNKPLNAAIGTVYYTAPEVLDGEYDERCDVWSVGVIVYLIIAGHVPFDDPCPSECMRTLSTTFRRGSVLVSASAGFSGAASAVFSGADSLAPMLS